jgi:hypothetical protein
MTMRPTRKIVAEFLGVFLVGLVIGGMATYSYDNAQLADLPNFDGRISLPKPVDTTLNTFMSRTADGPDSILARMNQKYVDEYHLTPDEMTRIEPTLKAMSLDIYTVRHQFGVDIMGTLDKYHAQIATQLTPDHQVAYQAAMAERRKKLSSLLLLDEGSPTATAK